MCVNMLQRIQGLIFILLVVNLPRVKCQKTSTDRTTITSPAYTTSVLLSNTDYDKISPGLSTKALSPSVVTVVSTLHSSPTAIPESTENQTTEQVLSGFEQWWSTPLHRYLVYGGAGGLGLILLFVLLCIVAVARGCIKRKGLSSNYREVHGGDGHSITLIGIHPADGSVDEDQLMQEKIIPVVDFTNYVNKLKVNANSGFEDEFDTLAKITRNRLPHTVSQLPVNQLKNRFDNVYPYDVSRVELTKIDEDPSTDYINASYIDGYDRGNAYIAAQGPLPVTIADFWRMIWELKITTLIMLTETIEAGKDKCEKYWPSAPNEPWDVGHSLMVTLSEQIPFAEYKVKIMKVENKMDPESCVPLIVTHYHFSAWPDHGVPADKTSLIHFIQRVRRHHPYFNSPPLLVHCSAGVGRTGTFITLDSMIHRMKSEDTLDIFAFVRRMRNNRPLMVQTEEQYVFIHDALEEFITCGDTSVGVANLRIVITKLNKALSDTDDDSTHFDKQFRILSKVSCKINTINCTEGKKPYNTKKNRYPESVPYNVSRVSLKQSAVKGSDYINASFIDGYKQQKAFIATQVPLKSTVNDFWRMIWENQCRAIVMLCNLDDEEEEDMSCYWPEEVNGAAVYGKLKVTLLSEEPQEDYIIRKLELREDTQYHIPGVVDYLVVTQVQHNDWTLEEVPDTKSVLQIIDTLLKIQRSTGNQTITVCCNDGMGRTGTFICIFSQLERIKTESICDVFQCVKAMRLQRPSVVQDVEQLIFCYQTLADYLDTFERYANFK